MTTRGLRPGLPGLAALIRKLAPAATRPSVKTSASAVRPVPTHVCKENATRRGGKICRTVPGEVVDPAISALLVELMAPMTLEVGLAVQGELEARTAETDALRRQHIERMR
jgi:hypothetical protein